MGEDRGKRAQGDTNKRASGKKIVGLGGKHREKNTKNPVGGGKKLQSRDSIAGEPKVKGNPGTTVDSGLRKSSSGGNRAVVSGIWGCKKQGEA